MIVIFCYFQKENYKVLKIHLNNSSFFEISTSLYKAPHLKASKLNKCRGQLLEKIRYVLCEWSLEEIPGVIEKDIIRTTWSRVIIFKLLQTFYIELKYKNNFKYKNWVKDKNQKKFTKLSILILNSNNMHNS